MGARWPWLTAALVCAAYLPFVLLPGPFFDGWAYAVLFEQAAWQDVLGKFMDNGRPVAAWVNLATLRLAGGTQPQLWFSLAGLVVAALAWSQAFWRTGLFSGRLCSLMGAVAVITPANQIILAAPTVVFVLAHTFYALALWVFMEARARMGAGRLALLALSCALAIASATLGEVTAVMLTLFPLMGLLAHLTGSDGPRMTVPRLLRAGLAASTPVALGLAAFVAMFMLFPPSGSGFVAERRISLHPADVMISAGSFAVAIVVAYAPLFAALWALARRQPPAGTGQAGHARERRVMLTMAVLCAGLVIGPYIAAMRLASPIGWGLRYLQYFGCVLAFLLAACLTQRDRQGRLTIAPAWFGWVAAALLLSLLVRWPFFAVRGVHADAVMAVIARSPQLGATDIVIVADATAVIGGPLRDLEWTGMVQKALGRGPRIAAIAEVDQDGSAIAALKLRLRQRMGWATPGMAQSGAEFIREQVRQLGQEPRLIALPAASCRVMRIAITAPGIAWHAQALGWYLRARLGPSASYARWLASSMEGRVTIQQTAPLTPCREAS